MKIHQISLEGKIFYLGYKVVTKDLKSLGLRKNPNIIKYSLNEWYFLLDNQIKKGLDDWGGIWVARVLSGAKRLRDYMKEHHSQDTRIFKATLDQILYFNSYRIKTNGVKLFEEVL